MKTGANGTISTGQVTFQFYDNVFSLSKKSSCMNNTHIIYAYMYTYKYKCILVWQKKIDSYLPNPFKGVYSYKRNKLD